MLKFKSGQDVAASALTVKGQSVAAYITRSWSTSSLVDFSLAGAI